MRFSSIESMAPQQMDFLPRERRYVIARLLAMFAGAALLVFILAYAPILSRPEVYLPYAVIALIAFLGAYTIANKMIDLDLLMAAEFQNLLYSQTAQIGSDFFMIVRKDSTIVHASDGLAKVFPQFDYSQAQALQGVFDLGTVRKSDRERLINSIQSGAQDHLIFPIFSQYDDKKDYIITVDPLARPTGFCVIRGRLYRPNRTGMQLLPDILRTTSIEKLSHLLHATTAAHYTTDAYGKVEYVNPAFERMFNYESGKILELKLSLHHLLFSLGNQLVTEEYTPSDYIGIATLVQNHGAHQKVAMMQTVMRDESGKITGVTGTILPPIG